MSSLNSDLKILQQLKSTIDNNSSEYAPQTITLSSGGWNENGEYTIEIDNITDNNCIDLLCPYNLLTEEQVDAVACARIYPKSRTNTTLTLKAYGDIPTIDISLVVVFISGV